MWDRNKRKGFTIVELVIVIAVISVLATVLVPSFSDVISMAKESGARQEAKHAYTGYILEKPEFSDALFLLCGMETVLAEPVLRT